MKPKIQSHFNRKLLLLSFFFLLLLLFILRSTLSSSPTPETVKPSSPPLEEESKTSSCSNSKIPSSLADTIIHYATSNTTPQQTLAEISVTARVLRKKSPCNFLVFGLGHDSLMWAALNGGGRTVFLDEDKAWIEAIRQKQPTLESYHVAYDTRVRDADRLFEQGRLPECTAAAMGGDGRRSGCRLALRELPAVFYEVEWDLIMVDAPTGWVPDAPGRMGAIYTAGMAARGRAEGETDVFVHDVDRTVEDKFSMFFLCEGYLREQAGRLRHFTIPSHRTAVGMPFCP